MPKPQRKDAHGVNLGRHGVHHSYIEYSRSCRDEGICAKWSIGKNLPHHVISPAEKATKEEEPSPPMEVTSAELFGC